MSLIGVFRLFPSSFLGRKYLTVKLSALGTSSRLAVHWAAVAGFAVRSVVARSRQCLYSFDFHVSLLGQLHHFLLQSVTHGTDLRHALI